MRTGGRLHCIEGNDQAKPHLSRQIVECDAALDDTGLFRSESFSGIRYPIDSENRLL